jgi:hypothetical protein
MSCSSDIKEDVEKAINVQEEKSEEKEIIEKVKGDWVESDSITQQETSWTFTDKEITWGKYTHGYTVNGDTIIISGVPYRLVEKTKEKITFYSPKTRKRVRLIRFSDEGLVANEPQ